MIKKSQKLKAELFQEMHRSGQLLVLPNAWDVVSAKIFELSGFKSIGTTSAGISSSLGYPDGQKMDISSTTTVILGICRIIDLPVSADIESGYSDTIEGTVQNVREVINAGAVGINIEDFNHNGSQSLYDKEFQKAKIFAIREFADTMDLKLFINARSDSFLLKGKNKNNQISETIERANSYLEAGADGIFVPDTGEFDKELILTLVNNIAAPLNIIAGVNTLPIPVLQEIGVSRVSLGPRPMRALLHFLQKISNEILEKGTFHYLDSGSITYSKINSWFGF
jgi:2-methylisocitrate lyase-like PEP mutase family enzyme